MITCMFDNNSANMLLLMLTTLLNMEMLTQQNVEKILSITSATSAKSNFTCQNGWNMEAWFYNPQYHFPICFVNISF